MILYDWAHRWGIPSAALAELLTWVQAGLPISGTSAGEESESYAQAEIRHEAAELGMRLWRNNVGALQDQTGRWMRFGLANDSEAVNRRIKSSDLVGIRPVTILPEHVGHVIGQFVCREVKAPGWRWSATEREQAQMRWIELVLAFGGDAKFATGRGTL